MKVYPISRSRDLTNAAVEHLKKAGHDVVLNWAEGRSLRTMDDWERKQQGPVIAVRDTQALNDCELVIMLWVEGMRAAFFEMGYAVAQGKRVVVVGCPDKDEMVFFHLTAPSVTHVETLAEALAFIAGLESSHTGLVNFLMGEK